MRMKYKHDDKRINDPDHIQYLYGYVDGQGSMFITQNERERYYIASSDEHHLRSMIPGNVIYNYADRNKVNKCHITVTAPYMPYRPDLHNIHYLRGFYDAAGHLNIKLGKVIITSVLTKRFRHILSKHTFQTIPPLIDLNTAKGSTRMVMGAQLSHDFFTFVQGRPYHEAKWDEIDKWLMKELPRQPQAREIRDRHGRFVKGVMMANHGTINHGRII